VARVVAEGAEHASDQIAQPPVVADLRFSLTRVNLESRTARGRAEGFANELGTIGSQSTHNPDSFGETVTCLKHGVKDRFFDQLLVAVLDYSHMHLPPRQLAFEPSCNLCGL